MTRRHGFGMRLEKMMQHMKQEENMLTVAPALRAPDVVNNHVADRFSAPFLAKEVLGERR